MTRKQRSVAIVVVLGALVAVIGCNSANTEQTAHEPTPGSTDSTGPQQVELSDKQVENGELPMLPIAS